MEEENQIDNDVSKTYMKEKDYMWNEKFEKITLDTIEQVFHTTAFLNEDYYNELKRRLYNDFDELIVQPIDEKFDDISNYYWSNENPNFDVFQKSRKLCGKELRKHYNKMRDNFVVDHFGLPKMVSLPIGKGKDVSERNLQKAIKYSDAMNVFVIDDQDTIITYNGEDHDKGDRLLVYMYVEELKVKYEIKELLKEKQSMLDYDCYKDYERHFHRIMDYRDKKSIRRETNKILFLESLSAKKDPYLDDDFLLMYPCCFDK